MEDVILKYPDFEDTIILNYFKGSVIKNGLDGTFFFENNILKIKWNNKDDIDEFIIDSNKNDITKYDITKYVYKSPIPILHKLNLKIDDNYENLTKIYIKEHDWEDFCILNNCYIYNELNNYKGFYSFNDDFLNIKWDNEEFMKKYFPEKNNSMRYLLCDDYENIIYLINSNIFLKNNTDSDNNNSDSKNNNELNSCIINIKNMNIYSIETHSKIGHFNLDNDLGHDVVIFYIKNYKYIYECPQNNLKLNYYYSIDLFKNNYYKNIILNNKNYILDKKNNILFEKYNKNNGELFDNIIIKDSKLIIESRIYETDLCQNDEIYYDCTDKYNKIVHIKNETWEEYCIINIYLNSFYRLSTGEYEKMFINNEFLIVYWKNWDTEIFIFNGIYNQFNKDLFINNCNILQIDTNIEHEIKIYKHEKKYDFLFNKEFKIIHKKWIDLCKITDSNIYRLSNNEGGIIKLLPEKNNIPNITIKWNQWDDESFYILDYILYSIDYIYYIYEINNNENPLYILNTYNNELFKYNNENTDLLINKYQENVFLQDNKIIINNITYFYKNNDDNDSFKNNIYIYLDYIEKKVLIKEYEIEVQLNILSNEIIYNNANNNIIYGKYFFEKTYCKNNIENETYLNIYWDGSEYNEIYKLLNDGKFYYNKYIDFSLKTIYLLYDENSYKIDYFNQVLYNNYNSIRFLKNKKGDKFYILFNDEIKEFFIYNFNESIVFLLDYNYKYLNNDIFIPEIYKTYLKNILKSTFYSEYDRDLFKYFLKRVLIEKDDVYSGKSFINKYLIGDLNTNSDTNLDTNSDTNLDSNSNSNSNTNIHINNKDIIKWFKYGNIIKIYEKNSAEIKKIINSIIILNIDNIKDENNKVDDFIKNLSQTNLNYDIIINFNIDKIVTLNISKYYDFLIIFQISL
jgi:hypothetical protein